MALHEQMSAYLDETKDLLLSRDFPFAVQWLQKAAERLESLEAQAASTNTASLSCQSCKRFRVRKTHSTCMACVHFCGVRTDWHEQA